MTMMENRGFQLNIQAVQQSHGCPYQNPIKMVNRMTTTELIELLKKYERGGATGRPREVMFEVGDRIIDTYGIEVIGAGDGLISELYLSLPDAEPKMGGAEE